MRVTPFTDPRDRLSAGTLGMKVLLVSLSAFFAASLFGYFVIRYQTRALATDLPPLPRILWFSTAALMLSSVTMHMALRAVRSGRAALVRVMMLLTTYLGITFLILQMRGWLEWYEPVSARLESSDSHRYALAGFFVLTGVHAVHVIGGLVPLAVITRHVFQGLYTADRHAAMLYVSMYWHFLDVVWLALFAALLLTV